MLLVLCTGCLEQDEISTSEGNAVSGGSTDDFYAYYTRLDYEIPVEAALDYIPQEDEDAEEEDDEDEDEAEEEDEEDEEEEGVTDGPISGKYADVIVNLGDGQLVFSRESSYRPYWETADGKWLVDDLIRRDKDVACLYTYARIIENKPDSVLIHWRYMPDLENPSGFAGVVNEYYEVSADGNVKRRVKEATANLDDYNDPANVTVQRLKLGSDGIKQVSLKRARLSKQAAKAIKGSPVKAVTATEPVAWWKFDEGLNMRPYGQKDLTKETVGGTDCPVAGNTTLWKKGVSGTALAFDGYESSVTLPAPAAPQIEDELTLEAWVVVGAYPWNWAPLVHQSVLDPGPVEQGTYDERGKAIARKSGRGYYLGIGPYGKPIFTVDGIELEGSVKLSTNRWTHVAATYGNGKMRIYVDGKVCGETSADGDIGVPATDLVIGLNNVEGRATDPVRGPNNHMAIVYGIEGLIDEVKIYDETLDLGQVKQSFQQFNPGKATVQNPDIDPRILPGESGLVKEFGAYHTKLSYHDLWDNLWRTSDHPDLVVKFDAMPTSVVYWRGANGAAGWVTENNMWMEDQSCETGGPHGCSEHMADKDYRHAHVRLIENTDARIVIHWRYASIDVGYLFPDLRHWADEYHTIYPDGTGVRKVYFRNGSPGWQDIQFFTQPGTTAMDTVNLQALSLANLEGKTRKLTWALPNKVPENKRSDKNCIEVVNFKSDYKVFLIFQEGTYITPWGGQEQSRHTDDPFAGPWNHWPISQIPSDGRHAVGFDRVTHAAIAAADNVTRYGNMAIYGFTKKDISTLVPLARMWNNPPELARVRGCSSKGYDKNQRAYILSAENSKLSFKVNASEKSPMVNPCFVVKKWSGGQAALVINGKAVKPGKNFRQGVIRDTDGSPTLVVWLKMKSDKTARFSLMPVGK